MAVDIAALDSEVLAYHTALIERLIKSEDITSSDATRYVMGAASYTAHVLHSNIMHAQRFAAAANETTFLQQTRRDPPARER